MDLAARFAVLAAVLALPLGAALASNVLAGQPSPSVPAEVRVGGADQVHVQPAPPARSETTFDEPAPSGAVVRPRVIGGSDAVVAPPAPKPAGPPPPSSTAQPPPTNTPTVPPSPPSSGGDDDGDDGGGDGGGDDGEG